jgi:hypothetical protein
MSDGRHGNGITSITGITTDIHEHLVMDVNSA